MTRGEVEEEEEEEEEVEEEEEEEEQEEEYLYGSSAVIHSNELRFVLVEPA